ncbi:MAG: hypothetical protein GF353_19070 [Candidatus Lokiarchaeota archaeon]|nr:hypothetical protein [Candidatus Lokiarchaeota archaeon]
MDNLSNLPKILNSTLSQIPQIAEFGFCKNQYSEWEPPLSNTDKGATKKKNKRPHNTQKEKANILS